MLTKSEFAERILNGHTPSIKEKATAFAPANIALIKYWGKRDSQLNLPVTDSLSIDLGNLGTETTVEPSGSDIVILNGNKLAPEDAFAVKVINFVDLFRNALNQAATNRPALTITTNNNIPTGAGVASSASGFAAMTMALDQFYGLGLAGRELSLLANLGSGSASRSIFTGFVYRHAGTDPDGMDSYSEPLPYTWPELKIGLITVSAKAKQVSSRDGMERTVATSPLYKKWPDQVKSDMAKMLDAIKAKDFELLGATAENNALAMHECMRAATPPLNYFEPETEAIICKVQELRKEGLPIYLTIDAGPNVKLLYLNKDEEKVKTEFPDMRVVNR
ncbi:MAG: diphosphomevalonate decarboxylase [Spirochaetia bacterium]|nr:diphosphomevalonate decarboxylase [Spirochaetia bacterium]